MSLLPSLFLNSRHFKMSKPLWQCCLELHLLQKICLSLEFSSVLIQEFPFLFSESVIENTDRTKLSFNNYLELKTINQPTCQNVLSFPIFSYIILKTSICNWHVLATQKLVAALQNTTASFKVHIENFSNEQNPWVYLQLQSQAQL